MTIERLSFPKGIPIQTETEVILVATKNIQDFRALSEDEVIEPGLLKRYKYKREVKLSPNKNSALVSPNTSETASKYDATNVKPNPDGSFRLKDPNDMFAVVGPGARKGEVRLYEFIRYVPSPHERRTTRRSS